jgi:hypothetical protein
MIYLPLDKLLERARSRETPDPAVDQVRASPEIDAANVDGRARGER